MSNARSTINETWYATHYLQATAELLDAVAKPAGDAFDKAYRSALRARRAAFLTDAPGGDIEWVMSRELAHTIVNAARRHGYLIITREEALS